MTKIALAAVALLALGVAATAQTKRGWLAGNWEGTGYQNDSKNTWTMQLDARAGKFTVEYPSLGCAGEWRPVRRTRWRATFTETITRGADRCEPRGNVTLLRLGGGQLLFLYSYEDSRQVIASAVLERRRR